MYFMNVIEKADSWRFPDKLSHSLSLPASAGL
jgi:hypothetical protein